MEKQGEAYYRYSYRELAAFCLQVSLLLESAVPLDEGLAIMAEDAADKKEKDMLLYMAEGVELGDPFFKVLEDAKVFPDYVVKMAKLGQQTGTMDQMMQSLSQYYDKEYRLIQAILINNQDLIRRDQEAIPKENSQATEESGAFIRGAAYYGGGDPDAE